MNDYLSFRHVHVTEDPFDDQISNQQPVSNQQSN